MGWRSSFFKATRADKTSTFAGNLTVSKDLTINGNFTFGDAASDALTVNGTLTTKQIVQIDDNKNLQFEGISGDSDGMTVVCDSSGDATISVTSGALTLSTSEGAITLNSSTNAITATGETITADTIDAKVVHEDTTYTASGAMTTGGLAIMSGAAKLEMTLADPSSAGKSLTILQSDSNSNGHTVTAATANSFLTESGSAYQTLTFDNQYESVSMISIAAQKWLVLTYSGVAFS